MTIERSDVGLIEPPSDPAGDPAEGRGAPTTRSLDPDVGLWASIAAAVSVLIMAPVFIRLVNEPLVATFDTHDFAFHLDLAHAMQLWPLHLTMPHPLFHLAVRALDPVLGTSGSAVAVLLAAIGAMAVALTRIYATPAHRRAALTAPTAATLAILYFASESPNLILQSIGILPLRPFTPVHLWGNPTETVALATALFLLPAVAALVDRIELGALIGALGPLVAALTVISALAKPALILALVPGSLLHLAARRRLDRPALAAIGSWFIVPAAIVVGWQTWFLETAQSPQLRTGFTWDPFALLDVYNWTTGGPFYWLPTLVPLAAAVVGRRRFWSERTVALSLWSMLIALVPLLLMRETGPRAYDGNLAKSGYYCWALLWILSVRFWALEARDAWRARADGRAPRVTVAFAAIATLVVASGVLALLGAAGAIVLPDSWAVAGG